MEFNYCQDQSEPIVWHGNEGHTLPVRQRQRLNVDCVCQRGACMDLNTNLLQRIKVCLHPRPRIPLFILFVLRPNQVIDQKLRLRQRLAQSTLVSLLQFSAQISRWRCA